MRRAIPKSFKEAPELAELVKQGKLPPVAQRLPAEPLVLKPLKQVGRYGGTWRRGFVGPGDGENGNRINASDKLLFWDYTGNKIIPSIAKSVVMSDDGKVTRVTLRAGMKWSDGAPFTADDFVFWFEDIYGNREVVPTGIADMSPGGKPGKIVKVDATHGRIPVRGALLPADRDARRRHADRRRHVGRHVPEPLVRLLRAGALSQAVPAEILLGSAGQYARARRRVRELGAHAAQQEGLEPESRAAGDRPVAHRAADQHADLGDGAQSLLLRGRHRREPACPTSTRS